MSVPILIDSSGSGIVRCTYFYIDAFEPQPDWALHLGAERIPILLLGLSAIVVGALDRGPFSSADEIEQLFARVEELPGLSVEVSDIWLPTFVFRNQMLKRGALFRIDRAAFNRAFVQTRDGFDYGQRNRALPERLEFSIKETNAFAAWGQRTINRARETFPKDRELQLRYRGPEPYFDQLLPPPENPPLLGQ